MPVLLLLLFLAQATPSAATQADAEQFFALGVRLFAEGDATGAAAAFEGAGATGWKSGMLEYNLGTAYLDLNQPGPAILHFERARRLMPGNTAISHNLRIAREQAGIVDSSPSLLALIGNRTSNLAGSLWWLAFGFVLYVALVALTGYRVWTRDVGPWKRRVNAALVPVTVLVLIVALTSWENVRTPAGIILAEGAQLREAPSPEATALTSPPPGQRVRLVEARGNWQAVRLPGGAHGWLPSRAVERI